MNADIMTAALALVERSDTCLVGSIDRHGYPAIRAMLKPREREGMKNLIFSTNLSSNHVSEFQENDSASVYFYDPNVFQGLLLRGYMSMTQEQGVRDRIWQVGDDLYYSLGPTDPDYCAMLFTAGSGRWYEGFSSCDFEI